MFNTYYRDEKLPSVGWTTGDASDEKILVPDIDSDEEQRRANCGTKQYKDSKLGIATLTILDTNILAHFMIILWEQKKVCSLASLWFSQ